MNKKSNKGFLLAESLIVTTFVLTVLIYLFAQFKNLMIEYKNNYRYNTVENIYNLGSLGKYIDNHDEVNLSRGIIYINEQNLEQSDNIFISMASEMGIEYIIFDDSDIEKVKNNINGYNQDIVKQDMIDFIEKVKTIKIENKGRLIAKFTNGNFATILIEQAPN